MLFIPRYPRCSLLPEWNSSISEIMWHNMGMVLKIVSDGTKQGTRIVDAQTNQPLDNVSGFMVTMDGSGISASLFVEHVAFEITAPQEDYEYAVEMSRQILSLRDAGAQSPKLAVSP